MEIRISTTIRLPETGIRNPLNTLPLSLHHGNMMDTRGLEWDPWTPALPPPLYITTIGFRIPRGFVEGLNLPPSLYITAIWYRGVWSASYQQFAVLLCQHGTMCQQRYINDNIYRYFVIMMPLHFVGKLMKTICLYDHSQYILKNIHHLFSIV